MVDLIFFKFKKINDLIKVNKSILLSSFQYNDTKNGLIQQINLNIKWLELNIEKIIKLVQLNLNVFKYTYGFICLKNIRKNKFIKQLIF